jgi:hypothetical protein
MPDNHAAAMAGYHPAAPPGTPMVMPMSQTTYHPAQPYPWGTAAHEILAQIWTADGAVEPAVTGGPFGEVRPAGRP